MGATIWGDLLPEAWTSHRRGHQLPRSCKSFYRQKVKHLQWSPTVLRLTRPNYARRPPADHDEQ